MMRENSYIEKGKEKNFVFHFIFSTGMTTFKNLSFKNVYLYETKGKNRQAFT